jgi:hypothetical protein
MKHGPLVIRPNPDPVMWWWLVKMLRNCTAARYAVNKSRMIPIAEYSRDCLRALRAEIGIRYDERSQGTLQLFRKQAQLDGTADDIAVLEQYGVPYEVLDRDGCIAAEPALAGVKDKIAAVSPAAGRDRRLPDVHAALAVEAAKLGVQFKFNVSINRLVTDGARITGVATSAGLLQADSYVVALGSWSQQLLRGRRFHSGLCREGLFDHRDRSRRSRRAGLHRDGRELQGRDHAAGNAHPRRRHRRSVGLFRTAASGAPRHARSFADRPVFRAAAIFRRANSGAACAR